MFTDAPFLSLLAADRHRELIADAERYRLGRLARAAHKVRPARSRPVDPDPVPRARRPQPAGECRTPVPR